MTTPYGREYVPDPRFGVQPAVQQAPPPVERDRSSYPVWDPTETGGDAFRATTAAPVPPRSDLLPAYGGYGPPPRQGMPTWAKVLIAVGGGIAAVWVLGVVAAIAIPTFLAQREKAMADQPPPASAPAALTVPDTIAGLPRVDTPEAEAMVQQATSMYPEILRVQGAVYGTAEEPLVVVAVSFPEVASDSDQARFREGALQVSEDSDEVVEMTPYETGVDDAWFGCSQTAVSHVCMSTRPTGAVIAATPLTGIAAVELGRAAHAAIE